MQLKIGHKSNIPMWVKVYYVCILCVCARVHIRTGPASELTLQVRHLSSGDTDMLTWVYPPNPCKNGRNEPTPQSCPLPPHLCHDQWTRHTHIIYTHIDKISWIKPIATTETLQLYNVYANESIFVHDKAC